MALPVTSPVIHDFSKSAKLGAGLNVVMVDEEMVLW